MNQMIETNLPMDKNGMIWSRPKCGEKECKDPGIFMVKGMLYCGKHFQEKTLNAQAPSQK